MFTDSEYRCNYTWLQPTQNYLSFKIRSCDNGHVLLSTSLMDVSETAAYEIVLGAYENTISDIRRGAHGEILVQANTPNILNCDEFLPFWLRWGNGMLIVGSGPLDSHVIMQYSDPMMAENFVATVSSWISVPAEFHFLEAEGMKFLRLFYKRFLLSTSF